MGDMRGDMSGGVYLAGPIAGLTVADGQSWRDDVAAALAGIGITCFSPLRGKARVIVGAVPTGPLPHPLTTDAAVMRRDYFDCMRADVVAVHLAGAKRVSVGTCMELAWAYAAHKPVVATFEDGDMHDHPMVRAAVSHRARDLDELVVLVRAILLPDAGNEKGPAEAGPVSIR
jgi:nucleoside 2-deoxyribosyltransferase